VLRRPLHDAQLLFRMRGDPYWGIHHWIGNGLKRQVALRMLKHVDGCLAMARHQAEKYVDKAGRPTRMVPLSIDANAWPTVAHADHELRLVSLTNLMYPDKIDPLLEVAPEVNDLLREVGGRWRICGDGKYVGRLIDGLRGLPHVEYGGFVDANAELAQSNVMVHLSELDVFCNAVMEGMASHLPVVTNSHPAFTAHSPPLRTVGGTSSLVELLRSLATPETRQVLGDGGAEYIRERYSHERVGRIWRNALFEFHRADEQPARVLDTVDEPVAGGDDDEPGAEEREVVPA